MYFPETIYQSANCYHSESAVDGSINREESGQRKENEENEQRKRSGGEEQKKLTEKAEEEEEKANEDIEDEEENNEETRYQEGVAKFHQMIYNSLGRVVNLEDSQEFSDAHSIPPWNHSYQLLLGLQPHTPEESRENQVCVTFIFIYFYHHFVVLQIIINI